MSRPVAPACERNKGPILEVLKKHITPEHRSLLEVGSGTGQHAHYLAPHFPHLQWTTSDILPNHEAIKQWINDDAIKNVAGPVEYEVGRDSFPTGQYNIVFTANTFHIMAWDLVKNLISQLGENLSQDALVIIYGPFNYQGDYTSASNKDFDQWLKQKDPLSAIRHFEDVKQAFTESSFILVNDHEMPANNRMLVFQKTK